MKTTTWYKYQVYRAISIVSIIFFILYFIVPSETKNAIFYVDEKYMTPITHNSDTPQKISSLEQMKINEIKYYNGRDVEQKINPLIGSWILEGDKVITFNEDMTMSISSLQNVGLDQSGTYMYTDSKFISKLSGGMCFKPSESWGGKPICEETVLYKIKGDSLYINQRNIITEYVKQDW